MHTVTIFKLSDWDIQIQFLKDFFEIKGAVRSKTMQVNDDLFNILQYWDLREAKDLAHKLIKNER